MYLLQSFDKSPRLENSVPNKENRWEKQGISHTPRCLPRGFFLSRGSSHAGKSTGVPVSIQIDANQHGLEGHTPVDLGLVGLEFAIVHHRNIDSIEHFCDIFAFVGDGLSSRDMCTVSSVFFWSPVVSGMTESVAVNSTTTQARIRPQMPANHFRCPRHTDQITHTKSVLSY